MTARDIMTASAETVAPDATLQEAAQIMKRLDVGALPVCDGDRIAGILTDRDIVVRALADGRDASSPVREAMTEGVVYCQEDTSVETVAEVMQQRQIRRILVLDSAKRLVGIVSLGDLATAGNDRRSGEVLETISAAPASPGQ